MFDACPSKTVYEEFTTSDMFRDAVAAAGLPAPHIEGLGDVQVAHLRTGGPAVTDGLALLDATAQADLVRPGEVTAAELVTAAIERIEALNPVLNAVVTPVFDRAARAARAGPVRPVRRACRSCSRTLRSRWTVCASPRGRASCATTCPPSNPSSWSGCGEPASSSWARPTRPSSGWRRPASRCCSARPATRGTRPVHQRIERRLGRRGRGRHGAVRARQRHGRLDPLPGVGVRPVRAEADPGPQPARPRVRRRRRAAGRSSTR